MTKIIAVDFSITSPGVVLFDSELDRMELLGFDPKNEGTTFDLGNKRTLSILPTYAPHKNDLIRFTKLKNTLISEGLSKAGWFVPDNETVIAIEGYSFGASGQLTRIAEACAILKYGLCSELGCDAANIITVAPTTLKKFATGSGATR